MKVAWADLKNQNKHLFIDKKKQKDGFTVTVKLLFDKDIVAVAEYNKSCSESDHSTYQQTPAVTNFNYPIEDYVNSISTDLSAQMMRTQNYGQNW